MIKRIYYTIFGQEAPLSGFLFMRKFSEAGIGLIGSSLFSFLLTIAAARLLGPSQYGEVQYLIAISAVFIIFPMFGINFSMLKMLHKDSSIEEESSMIKLGMSFIFFNSILLSLLIIILHALNLPLLSQVSFSFLALFLIFSFFFAFRMLFQSILQSKEQFRFFSFIAILSIAFALIFFFISSLLFTPSFFNYFVALLLWHFSFSLLFIFNKRKFLYERHAKSSLSKHNFISLYRVFLPGFFAVLFGVFFQQIDKLFVQTFFNAEQLGIYVAYLSLVFMVVSLPLTILNHVLMPSFANKVLTPHLMRVIEKSLFFSFPIIFGVSFFLAHFGEFFYGSVFHVSFALQLLFPIYALFYAYYYYLASIFSVSLPSGFTKFALLNGGGIALFVIGFFIFTPSFGLEGVLLTQVILYALLCIICIILMKKEAKMRL